MKLALILLLGALGPMSWEGVFDKADEAVEAGREALARGEAELALERFEESIARHPGSAALQVNRGLALHELGRVEEARAAFKRALGAGGAAREAFHGLGHSYASTGELDEALAAFQNALEADPDDEAARRNVEALLRRQAEQEQEGAEGDGEDERGEDESGQDERGEDESGQDERGEDESGEDERGEDESGEDESGEDERGEDESGEDERGEDESGEDESGEVESGEDESGEDESGEDESGEVERGQQAGEQEDEQEGDREEAGGVPEAGEREEPAAVEELPLSETERILDAMKAREKSLQLWRHQQQKGRGDGEKDW